MESRVDFAKVAQIDDPYVFPEAADGSVPWKPDAVSQYFSRMRKRTGLDHLDFHYICKFMETDGQEMGHSITKVAMRAGRDPSITAKHLQPTSQRNRPALATALASLIAPGLDAGAAQPCISRARRPGGGEVK